MEKMIKNPYYIEFKSYKDWIKKAEEIEEEFNFYFVDKFESFIKTKFKKIDDFSDEVAKMINKRYSFKELMKNDDFQYFLKKRKELNSNENSIFNLTKTLLIDNKFDLSENKIVVLEQLLKLLKEKDNNKWNLNKFTFSFEPLTSKTFEQLKNNYFNKYNYHQNDFGHDYLKFFLSKKEITLKEKDMIDDFINYKKELDLKYKTKDNKFKEKEM